MIFIDFKLNQESIAEAHCINKDKPEMNCDGKCYLKKQLEKTKKDKKPLQSPRYFESEWVVYSSEIVLTDFTLSVQENIFEHVYISMFSEPHTDLPEIPPQTIS